MNNGGPFYKTIQTLADNRTGTVAGSSYVTAINRVVLGNWPSGGTTTVPTQFGGTGTGYTEFSGSVHVMSVKFT
jgi:ABC-type phosphate transport system substrate-binding protein